MRELAGVLSDLDLENYVEQDVPQLVDELSRIALLHRLDELVTLLEEQALHGGVGLLAVPWTAAGAAQTPN